jgi:hypothetical protein
MHHEVTVGQGIKGTTAIHIRDLKGNHSISKNYSSYWISNLLFGCRMTIFMDTNEGKLLANMIERHVPLDSILEWLNHTLLRNMEPAKIMDAVVAERMEAYEEGRRAKADEIREALYC